MCLGARARLSVYLAPLHGPEELKEWVMYYWSAVAQLVLWWCKNCLKLLLLLGLRLYWWGYAVCAVLSSHVSVWKIATLTDIASPCSRSKDRTEENTLPPPCRALPQPPLMSLPPHTQRRGSPRRAKLRTNLSEQKSLLCVRCKTMKTSKKSDLKFCWRIYRVFNVVTQYITCDTGLNTGALMLDVYLITIIVE